MTRDELVNDVWESLSARKHLLGRARVGRIVDRALKSWPAPVLAQCDAKQTDMVARHFTKQIKREAKQEVGMGFIAAIILGTIISEIVKRLVAKWWSNREEMLELCR